MEEFFTKVIWELSGKDYFLLGHRPLFLVPIILVPLLFYAIRHFKKLTSLSTLTNRFFLYSSSAVCLACVSIFLIVTHIPPPSNRLVIAIPQFYSTSDAAVQESKNIRDRIIRDLKARQIKYGTMVVIKDLKDSINILSDDGLEEAKTLGRHHRAHIVICGKVRLDEQYYFEPAIINMMPLEERHRIRYGSKGGALSFSVTLSQDRRLQLKEQKVGQVADFVTFVFGLSKFEAKDFKQARQIFDSMKTPTVESLLYGAKCSMRLKEYDAGISLLDKALNLDPGYLEAWSTKGLIYLLTKDFSKADEAASKATTLKPESDTKALALAWTAKGIVLLEKDRLRPATDMFDKAIGIKPNLAVAWFCKSLALYSEGLKLLITQDAQQVGHLAGCTAVEKMEKKHAESIRMLNKALALDPNEAEYWSFKGRFLLAKEGLKEEALIAFDKAIQLQPDLESAWDGKAEALVGLGRSNDADAITDRWDKSKKREFTARMQKIASLRNLYKSARSSTPNVQRAKELFSKGGKLATVGELDRAWKAFSSAITFDPDYAEAWFSLAVISYIKGRIDDAFRQCKQALVLKPDYPQAWWLKGAVLHLRGKWKDSLKAFSEATKLQPGYAKAWVGQGHALLDMKRYEEALAMYEKAVGLQPDDATAWFGKYQTLIALGRRKEALIPYNRSIGIDPDLAWEEYGVPE